MRLLHFVRNDKFSIVIDNMKALQRRLSYNVGKNN